MKKDIIRTWHVEASVVAVILIAVAWGRGFTEWVGAAAVFFGFLHGKIADRMAEQQALMPQPSVECYNKSIYYWVCKELLWLCYFLMHSSYSALAGVAVFLLYPIWRKIWRHYKPLNREQR